MLQVHNEGKAVVANGTRETCEVDVARLHAHGLWATMQHDTMSGRVAASTASDDDDLRVDGATRVS